MARYEFRRGKVAKFWAPRVEGKRMFLHFGKIGSAGQTRLKDFATAAAAKQAMAVAVADKLADGYVDPAAKPAKPALPPAKRTAMLAIAGELGGKAIAAEVAMAIDTPEAYIAKFIDTYGTIEDAEHAEVPWLGLIEALGEHSRLAEVDWKEYGTEVLGWLERLGGAAAKRALKPARAEGEALDERPTFEAIERCGALLAGGGLGLIQLDKDSDSYALAVVPVARVAPLQKLARTAGAKIEHFAGKQLAALERDSAKRLAKERAPKNTWAQLVADNDHQNTAGAADSVLWNLNHDETIETIRTAAPFAPARDRPLVDMVIALYDGAPAELAKTTKQPELLLAALKYVNVRVVEGRYQRLAAAAILAERLRVPLDGGKRHMAILDACNVWNPGKATDGALARLPAADRTRLARLGDAMLARARGEGGPRWASALRMLTTCGDATSLPLLEKAFARAMHARRDNEYDLTVPEAWTTALASIRRRAKVRS